MQNKSNASLSNFLNKDCVNNVNSFALCDREKYWYEFNFTKAEYSVKKLQRRIEKALVNNKLREIRYYQSLLIHSYYAKMLAVDIVTTNRGRFTPGIDNIVWHTAEDKINAVNSLKNRGYKPRPLKRIFIPKPNGKTRPLSIPTMKDRAMQTLYKFALEPISEYVSDTHSYGFRPNLSTFDALVRCHNIIYTYDYKWVLKADVKACFDNLSHRWVMDNIPLDKHFLKLLLNCGYIHEGIFYKNDIGIPQGGALSPIICNMAMNGLENKLKDTLKNVEFIRYADDILVFSPEPHKLGEAIILINEFLSERGLSLSKDKTMITETKKGFDFLGWYIKSTEDKPFIIPSRKNVESLLNKISHITNCQNPDNINFDKFRATLIGWKGYHRNATDGEFMNKIYASLYSYIPIGATIPSSIFKYF